MCGVVGPEEEDEEERRKSSRRCFHFGKIQLELRLQRPRGSDLLNF